MRTLIYSDVHGNLPAFELMLRTVGYCDRHICLGDLVDFGPWSNECVDLAISLPCSTLIMGNHEEDFLKGFHSGTNKVADIFFDKTIANFDRFDEIATFIPKCDFQGFTCQHTIDGSSIYPDTAIDLRANYIIGHSHHQFSYLNGGYVLHNAGSVGQNRKYINICNYIVYDSDLGVFDLCATPYNINTTIREMEAQSFPKVCIDYYQGKERAS